MSATSWSKLLRADPIPWLLEPDADNPGVRYFTLVDLLDAPPGSQEAQQARAAVMANGPVPAILDAQSAEGYWVTPGAGYNPKYRSTVWSVTFLAQLGADGNDERVKKGCQTVLENNLCALGGLSYNGSNSGMIHCLQGNLAAALIDLGWLGDERLARALDWLARSITGEGIAPAAGERYTGSLLPQRQQRAGLCLRGEQPPALRLGSSQSRPGVGQSPCTQPDRRNQAGHCGNGGILAQRQPG